MFFARSKKSEGFSLIELLLVIAIIGAIASTVLLSFQKNRRDSRDTKRVAELTAIQGAIESYYDDKGYYPMCTGNTNTDWCRNADLTSAHSRNVCYCLNTIRKGASPSTYGDFTAIQVTPTYIRSLPQDPVNDSYYNYVYMRGYSKRSPTPSVPTNLTSDYVLLGNREGVNCSATPASCVDFGGPSWTFSIVLGN